MSAYTANNPAVGDAVADTEILARRARRGASWFYWVAGLSVVNTIIVLAGSTLHFVIGLGITEVFDVAISSLVAGSGGTPAQARGVTLACSLVIAAVFVLFGYFASRLRRWAFIAGILVYAIDAVIVVGFGDYFGAAFHAYVLFELSRGMLAASRHANLRMHTAYAGAPRPAVGHFAYASGVAAVPQPVQPTIPPAGTPNLPPPPPRAAVYSCPSCGAAGEGMNFCGECGAEIRIARTCSRCTASVPPGSKFCGECGAGAL